MKYTLLLTALFAFALQAVEVSEVEQYTNNLSASQIIWSQDFENAEKNSQIKIESGRLAPREGRVGTTGVIFERTKPDAYHDFVSFKLPTPEIGKRYKLSFHARCDNIAPEDVNLSLACVEFADTAGNWTHGMYPYFINRGDEWHEYTMDVWLHEGDVEATLNLFLQKEVCGKIWYDDFYLTSAERNIDTLLLAPQHLTATPGKNDFLFQILPNAPDDAVLLVIAENGGRTQKQLTKGDADGLARLVIDDLVDGPLKLSIQLASPSQKRIVGVNSFNMVVRELKAQAVSSGYDADGVFRVNGEPTAPLGIFSSTIADYPKLVEAGFTFVIPYIGINWRSSMVPPDQYSNDPIAVFRKFLDNADAVGLKVAFSLTDLLKNYFKPDSAGIQDFKLGNDNMAIAAKIVEGIKDHPALLAWYINDETSIADLQNVIDMRELVSRIDPYHATISLGNEIANGVGYTNAGDIFSFDAYPIYADSGIKQSLRSSLPGLTAAELSRVPHWFTTQIFNWATYNFFKKVTEPDYSKTHTPTLDEMRALALLSAVHGAKGLMCYAYEDVVPKPEARMPGIGEKNWKDVSELAAFMKDFMPFMTSTKPAPAVTVLSCTVEGEVEARAFVNAQGELRVAIVGLGEACTAVIQIEGAPELKSRFGHTTPLGDGKYQFTAEAINSDILQ